MVSGNSVPKWKIAQPDYQWSFPKDHWSHPKYKTEWWYFTGHLQPPKNPHRRFGYQFTFFRIGILNQAESEKSLWATKNLIMGHAAISDLQTKQHFFSEVLYREIPLLGKFGLYPNPIIAWSQGPAGTDQ